MSSDVPFFLLQLRESSKKSAEMMDAPIRKDPPSAGQKIQEKANEAAQVGREAGQQVKGQAQKFGQGIKQTAYDRPTQQQEHSKGMLDKMKDTISDAADMVQGKSKGQMENVKETYSKGN
ncbi:uncharacterized protein LOC116928690 isoform X1 [Daphnia magna]|uniref:uncharacterized protein LOC116928690 isoform X1 n=2 Tax=Daphnia magna TaxID=35525 RepID=UPI001E1BBF93|nr:uncharacterized protein LOC116928690 isoform X1 [Daphnia magna]